MGIANGTSGCRAEGWRACVHPIGERRPLRAASCCRGAAAGPLFWRASTRSWCLGAEQARTAATTATVERRRHARPVVNAFDVSGFWNGLTHPILGVDHLIAMVAVGVVSARLGRRTLWAVPSAFVMAMAAGGIAGLSGFVLTQAEQWIAASLIALGGVVALNRAALARHSTLVSTAALAFAMSFGAAHGNAHGLEIPEVAGPIGFAAGFLSGTSLLHLAGVGIGMLSDRWIAVSVPVWIAGVFAVALGGGLLVR